MKRATLVIAVAISAAAAPCAMAAGGGLKAQVPFDFVVADQHLASGEYQLVRDPHTMQVRVYSGGEKLVAVAHWVPQPGDQDGKAQLVFRRYGSQRFLKAIHSGHDSAYLPETRSERNAQASAGSARAVAAR